MMCFILDLEYIEIKGNDAVLQEIQSVFSKKDFAVMLDNWDRNANLRKVYELLVSDVKAIAPLQKLGANSSAEYIESLSLKVQSWLKSINSPQISELSISRVQSYIDSNAAYLFIDNDNDTPIGSVFIEPLPEHHYLEWGLTDLDLQSALYMKRFMLDPTHIGKKIGDDMIREIQNLCLLEGKVMVLDTLETNAAVRKFYERNGFIFRRIVKDMEGDVELILACYCGRPVMASKIVVGMLLVLASDVEVQTRKRLCVEPKCHIRKITVTGKYFSVPALLPDWYPV
ncbi:hypothetical protein HK100_009755 [Physocladia obscura]|uniref:N-acetyltransferase domain-containing protein n=1 Tax=Physocladia obscura TaxID=109957 RepID=A0AAD5XA26_9FUNG|nr:hypothetical protein HK100_009755 [Physocladia obscura]